jgi:predicted DsbA family dithiol-disulfide isomerase
MKKFRKAMNRTELDAAIEADLALGASLGVNGTPAFFINGRPIEGAGPELQFRLLIEEELDRAAAARERGVSPEQLYDALTHQPLED